MAVVVVADIAIALVVVMSVTIVKVIDCRSDFWAAAFVVVSAFVFLSVSLMAGFGATIMAIALGAACVQQACNPSPAGLFCAERVQIDSQFPPRPLEGVYISRIAAVKIGTIQRRIAWPFAIHAQTRVKRERKNQKTEQTLADSANPVSG